MMARAAAAADMLAALLAHSAPCWRRLQDDRAGSRSGGGARHARGAGQDARSAARGRAETHLQFFLGDRRARDRAHAGSLAAAALLEHRGRGLRAQCLCHRRGTRLRHARAGARPRADHAALPARRAAGHLARPGHRLPGIFLSLRQLRHRQALRRFRTIYRRYRAAHGRGVVRRRLLRRGSARGSRDPPHRRRVVPARELALGHRARAGHPHGMEPGAAVWRPRLARLQRGHAGVHPGAGLAHLPGGGSHLGWPGLPTTTATGARSKARRT